MASALCLILTGRLFSIAILEHEAYAAQAEQQQNVERDIQPKRGTITVQDGNSGRTVAVAESVERFALSGTPKYVKNKELYAEKIASLTGVDAAEILAGFNRQITNPKTQAKEVSSYMDPVVHGLTQAQVENITIALNDLQRTISGDAYIDQKLNFDPAEGNILYFVNGIFFIREFERVYPEGALMGQLLGFVDNKGEGRYGFEGQFDNELRGYTGRVRLQQDSKGNVLGETGSLTGQDGTNYELTIDRNIQAFLEQSLAEEVTKDEAKGGSIIVIDPQTGAISGMASTPTYDPSNYRQVAKDDISLFDNPAISKQWEPGSIFKPLIMAAALDQGVVTPETRNVFPKSVVVDGYTINTALDKAYGDENMTDILVNSDNVAMVWLAEQMGNQIIASYLQAYGFGSKTGVDLKNEIAGTVAPIEKWRRINQATISFGQGIAVTPLQVITAYTAIANQGQQVTPYLVKAVVRADGSREEVEHPAPKPVLKSETANIVRDMLVSVVVRSHKRAGVDGYKLGGKTGTAQVPNPDGGGYLDNAFNHSFIGMGPADQPKFIILTKIDEPNLEKIGGLFAESTAVPLFSKVANFLLHYYQIEPTNR